jgi:hypothetical protein
MNCETRETADVRITKLRQRAAVGPPKPRTARKGWRAAAAETVATVLSGVAEIMESSERVEA